jgi:hypothetical protein
MAKDDEAESKKGSDTEKGDRKPRRTWKTQALSAVTFKTALPLLARRGLAEESLLTNWSAVVGPMLAARCHPQRLQRPRRGTEGEGCVLHLKVEGGSAAMEIQHRLPQLIERVNTFLGWRAVERVTLHQGRITRTPPKRAKDPPPLPAERRAVLERELADVEDPDLRAALERLGEAVGRLNGDRGG